MNLLRIFFLNIFIILLPFSINARMVKKVYRSNSNGLMLVEIRPSEKKNYKYYLYVDLTEATDDIIHKKVLYQDNKEIKKWLYYYSNNYLYYEKFYKEKQLEEAYRYDSLGHKIKEIVYNKNEAIRVITFTYNSDGLVATEKITNLMNKQKTFITYRYDQYFRIKQIEKQYPDGRLVYWESFFSDNGIIQKEYYTLKDERYIFWYNESGQEIKGEVKSIGENNDEKIKKEWSVHYSNEGKKERKDENNYIVGVETKTWYNQNYQETRIETYKHGTAVSIEEFEYDADDKIVYYERIEDLNSNKVFYKYDKNGNMISSLHYQDDALKKKVTYNGDKSRTEILFGKNDRKIIIEYDSGGKIISQKAYDQN